MILCGLGLTKHEFIDLYVVFDFMWLWPSNIMFCTFRVLVGTCVFDLMWFRLKQIRCHSTDLLTEIALEAPALLGHACTQSPPDPRDSLGFPRDL